MLRAYIVHVLDPRESDHADASMHELRELVSTLGGIVITAQMQKKSIPDYQTYLGTGKLTEIVHAMDADGSDLLIVGNLLKPKQTYTVQERVDAIVGKNRIRVRDKVDLILKIFEKHAKTTESKLQIELASLHHMGPRIFGMGKEMSRQGGGSKLARGLGETNTERMKRHLKEQKHRIEGELLQFSRMRDAQRQRRKKQGLTSIGVVGYTNAGKSSIINALSSKKVYAENKLFATLGTTVSPRIVGHDGEGKPLTVLLHDTIGFMRDLPPSLIQAFRSTLEDSLDTDYVFHVIDASDPERIEKKQVVDDILFHVGSDTPRCIVYNKIDRCVMIDPRMQDAAYPTFFVSAVSDQGLDKLLAWMYEKEASGKKETEN